MGPTEKCDFTLRLVNLVRFGRSHFFWRTRNVSGRLTSWFRPQAGERVRKRTLVHVLFKRYGDSRRLNRAGEHIFAFFRRVRGGAGLSLPPNDVGLIPQKDQRHSNFNTRPGAPRRNVSLH
jgi:hypothetical protein